MAESYSSAEVSRLSTLSVSLRVSCAAHKLGTTPSRVDTDVSSLGDSFYSFCQMRMWSLHADPLRGLTGLFQFICKLFRPRYSAKSALRSRESGI